MIPLFIKLVVDITVSSNLHILTNGAAYNALTIVNLKKLKIPLPNIDIQNIIVEQIEKEQVAVDSAKQLIEIFEQKITNRIAQIWGE